MTLPLDLETPELSTLPESSGLTPDGPSLPSGTAGAVGTNTKPAGGMGEEPPVTPTAPVHVIGLDVSLTATGVACVHGATLIRSNGKKTDTLDDRRVRLSSLVARTLVDATHGGWGLPALVVIEQPSYGSQTGSQHDRSGLWWLVVDQLLHRGIRVVEIAPATLKKFATGKGNADKDAVLSAAIRRLPIGGIDNNNAADAGFLCAIGHDLLGQPLCDLPALNRAAIDKHRPTVLPPVVSKDV